MPPPSPPLALLDSRVHINWSGDDGANIEGNIITSGDKLAIGFGEQDEQANAVVQGLELRAHLCGERDLSFLTLRGALVREYSCIYTVDKNLILIASAFSGIYPCAVYLIYDGNDRSLRMIPSKPRIYAPITGRVLVARPHKEEGDGDKSYALVFPGTVGRQDVLFLALSSSNSPWKTTKKAKFPDRWRLSQGLFLAEEVFSSHGRGYWVDLLCGVLYCDCNDILSQDIDCVHIRSFDLPEGCDKYTGFRDDIAEARAFRAMGPVRDSIKFVSIDGYLEHVDLKDCKVRVWKLTEDMTWTVDYELKLASLWDSGEFEGAWVPSDMAPMYPFLSKEEDNVIYFALGSLIRGKQNCVPKKPSCLLRVDLHNKTFTCTGLSDRQRRCITCHLALSSIDEDKLLRGSC